MLSIFGVLLVISAYSKPFNKWFYYNFVSSLDAQWIEKCCTYFENINQIVEFRGCFDVLSVIKARNPNIQLDCESSHQDICNKFRDDFIDWIQRGFKSREVLMLLCIGDIFFFAVGAFVDLNKD